VHDQVDVRPRVTPRLDQGIPAWRAGPDPGRKRIERKARAPVRSTCSLDPARMRGWPGWQNYRPTGVALAAVPGLGARPSWTSPSLPGAYATGCGPLRR
jgi:hypothetical protein